MWDFCSWLYNLSSLENKLSLFDFGSIRLTFSVTVDHRGGFWAVFREQVGARLFLHSICLGLISASVFAILIIWSFSFPICSACNMHCGRCDSQASCTSCRDPSKVLLFGDCQHESCAPQYYLDFSTKTCKGNTLPELHDSSFSWRYPFTGEFHSPNLENTVIRYLNFLWW